MFFIKRTPDLTKEFGGNSDIACDLVLGHPLGDQGVFLKKMEIPFFRRLVDRRVVTLL